MERLKEALGKYKEGEIELKEVLKIIEKFPYENLGFARIDHHRELRKGFPEVIYGQGKSFEHLKTIVSSMKERGSNVIVTRLEWETAKKMRALFPDAGYNPSAKLWYLISSDIRSLDEGFVAVVSAGTSDLPVAEEAALTAELMGSRVKRFYDVGVAGLHRLLDIWEDLKSATVWVVVAGMEGALPSVIGGIVEGPVIAVPTSIGYGSGFGGISALLAMLNSCVPGISVVNIDNGFGGGYVASVIHRKIVRRGG